MHFSLAVLYGKNIPLDTNPPSNILFYQTPLKTNLTLKLPKLLLKCLDIFLLRPHSRNMLL